MLNKKALLSFGVTALLLILYMSPVSANISTEKNKMYLEESDLIDELFDEIELAACNAANFMEFLYRISNIFKNIRLESFPKLQNIIDKIISWITSEKDISLGGKIIKNFFNKFNLESLSDNSKEYFVFSCGSYNRWNNRKDNEISLMKPGIEFWRYTGKSKLFKGRTLIIERHPFGIKQRVMGSQIGIMIGFRGLYIDWESKLTGNDYNLFIGRTNRIRALDTTPFSD